MKIPVEVPFHGHHAEGGEALYLEQIPQYLQQEVHDCW